MYKKIFILAIGIVLSLCADARMYGLFYGVDGYNLGCPENDVTDLAELYRKNDGQVILVRGDGVTRRNVLDGLKKQAAACTPNDLLMFIYSGHGNEGYIQCGEEFVEFSEIKSIMSSSKARRKVVLIEACHSGSFASQKYGKLNGENVIVITSSRKNEYSWERRGARNSYMVEAVLDGLNGKADKNNDGKVVAKELHNYLAKNASPMVVKQHPTMKGRFNENTILYTYRKSTEQKPPEANSKPSTPLPGVAPPSDQVSEDESSIEDLFTKYAKAVYDWISWWKVIGLIVLIAIVVIIFKYFVAYKLLMKYL